jgi:hypothetical protein
LHEQRFIIVRQMFSSISVTRAAPMASSRCFAGSVIRKQNFGDSKNPLRSGRTRAPKQHGHSIVTLFWGRFCRKQVAHVNAQGRAQAQERIERGVEICRVTASHHTLESCDGFNRDTRSTGERSLSQVAFLPQQTDSFGKA